MAYKHIGVAISGNEEDALLVNKGDAANLLI